MNNRNDYIFEYYKRGKKQSDIARMFNLTRQRIKQIVIKYQTKNNG